MLRLLASRCTSPLVLHSPLATSHKLRTRNWARPTRSASNMAIGDWAKVSTKPSVPPYSVYTTPVVKSDRDEREYRVIKLENGLEATLVHDPKAERSAASLDVAVGHLFDPVDMPGLAHFCEHLLFMGTEQFPKENEYAEFLTKNSGSYNAYTSTTNTNYYFNVAPSALHGALSRFAPFFHSPLFAPSCTARELKAVDSENKKNLQSDAFRMFQLNKHLTKPGHPWNKFGTGNLESLSKAAKDLQKKGLLKANGANGAPANVSLTSSSEATPETSRTASPAASASSAGVEMEGDGGPVGREIRRRLIEWWSREYSANRMKLCVIGKESLDELSDAVSTLFSPIASPAEDPMPLISGHPFGPDEMGTLVSAQTIMAFHCVEISFPIPYQAPFWKYHPSSFISHFIGHEGPGSAHSYLKKKGWITALSAGSQALGRGMGMMRITLQLTKEGFENSREVMLTIFKYFSMLREALLPPWFQREISDLSLMNFRFQDKRASDRYATFISEKMEWPVPRHLLLSAPLTVQPWDVNDSVNGGEREMRELLDSLRVTKARAVLMAQIDEHTRVKGAVKWNHEPWYGTAYHVDRFDEAFLSAADGPNDIPELFLPGPNEFIPTNLNVDKRDVATPATRPHLIRATPLSTLWHKKDDRFWMPRGIAMIDIRSPVAFESARAATLTRIFADLVTDSLTEFAYDAELADLSYQFIPGDLGITVTLHGYNDKLHVLAKTVFERARKLHVTEERLHVIKSALTRDWNNFSMNEPYRLADRFMSNLAAEKHWPLQDRLREVASVTVQEVQTHIARLLSEVKIRALVVGNMYKDEAIRLIESAEDALQSSPMSAEVDERTLVPSPGSDVIWPIDVPNPNESNSAITYNIHIGSRLDSRLRVTSQLLAQLMSDPAFNILRTRQQLGYIVACSNWGSPGDCEFGIRILVQSERTPAFLEERVDAFLDEMQQILENMTEEEFAEHKHGLETRWREPPKNLPEESNRFMRYIINGYYDFNALETSVELIPTITKDEVLTLFKTRIHYSSPTRAKTSIHLRSQKARPARVSEAALVAFEQKAKESGLKTEPSGWKDELCAHGEPLLTQAVSYWQPVLVSEDSGLSGEVAKELLESLPALAQQFPAQSNDEGKIKPGVVLVEDPQACRATRRLTEYPKPVVEWGDLPLSRY